jgi:two-component system, LytTR family, response regulator
MIKSVLIDSNEKDMISLEAMLSVNFPNIHICGKAGIVANALKIINECQPDLLFINSELQVSNGLAENDCFLGVNYQVILLVDKGNSAFDNKHCSACSFLKKPIQNDQLIVTVNKVLSRIQEKEEHIRNKFLAEKYFRESSNEGVIGIPTIEGFEFVSIKDIICCEGLQKCTRVITKEKTDIISSYNLGEFRKFLEPYGFFSPHKSHLINLKFIRRYHREGSILMTNGIIVPVAKRKKREFLDHIYHI